MSVWRQRCRSPKRDFAGRVMVSRTREIGAEARIRRARVAHLVGVMDGDVARGAQVRA